MDIIVADNFWMRFQGLMFRRKPIIIIFPFKKPTRFGASIHSFFVFFDFYALYVNSDGFITEKVLVKPFKLRITPKEEVSFLIEVPVTVGRKLNVGDYIGEDIEKIKNNLLKLIMKI